MLRNDITEAMKDAMRSHNERALSTTRMIMAKMKDLDIEARPKGHPEGISDAEIMTMLQGMIKQRRESIALYQQGHREDLVKQESEEITVIERFLPQQLSAEEAQEVIKKVIAATGAASVKDMGKVMAALKQDYAGRMDFSQAGPLVKAALGAA